MPKKSGGSGLGAGGRCICLKCKKTVPHKSGIPCMEMKCPTCGSALIREGSPHYKEYLNKQKKKE